MLCATGFPPCVPDGHSDVPRFVQTLPAAAQEWCGSGKSGKPRAKPFVKHTASELKIPLFNTFQSEQTGNKLFSRLSDMFQCLGCVSNIYPKLSSPARCSQASP